MDDQTQYLAAKFPIGSTVQISDLDRDPFPIYKLLREKEPITYIPDLSIFLVTRNDDVRTILLDDQNFVVGTEASLVYDTFGSHMMTVEGREHRRFRQAHQKFFLPPNIKSNLESAIRTHAETLIDEFAHKGEVDIRPAFAARLPVLTMLSLFGMRMSDEPLLRRIYDSFEAALSNFTWDEQIRADGKHRALEFHELIQSYLDDLAQTKRPKSSNSLLASLSSSEQRESLSDEEIRRNALIVFFGGISTVEALILNTLYALSTHPEEMDTVKSDIDTLPKAIIEVIRWQGPVQSATRHVASEVEVGGHRFLPGDTVNCMLASANRDPEVFEKPDSFIPSRKKSRYFVGFAAGPHHCLGSHLARAEARIAIEVLFDRLPSFQLDLARTERPSGHEFRQPTAAMGIWHTSQ